MRAIAAAYFQGSDVMGWPLVSLLLFMVVFALAVVRMARRRAADFDEVSRLPLEEDRHE